MLCMWTAACTFVNSIASISHCFFPAVSTAGNEFSAEIIQLQLPKCLILSFILILVCLLQPWQEMDVAALRFVQITKWAHKCFYLACWSRTLKWELNWPKQKRFLINVILLMILCKYMGVGTIHGTEVLLDWMKTNALGNTSSAHTFHLSSSETLQLRDCQNQSCFLGA